MIRLALFDLDGVIVDSEPLHERVRRRLLLEYSGGRADCLDEDPTGKSTEEYYARFLRRYASPASGAEAARRHYDGVLHAILSTLPAPIPGVRESIARLKSAGLSLAVVSSSPRDYVEGVLRHFDLMNDFSALTCGDEVRNLKPDPEIYLAALSRAGASAGEAIAVEDSRSGLSAALAAGIPCVAYAAPAVRAQDFAGAAKRIASMADFAPFVLGRPVD